MVQGLNKFHPIIVKNMFLIQFYELNYFKHRETLLFFQKYSDFKPEPDAIAIP